MDINIEVQLLGQLLGLTAVLPVVIHCTVVEYLLVTMSLLLSALGFRVRLRVGRMLTC